LIIERAPLYFSPAAMHVQVQFLTCLGVELHIRTRGSLRPDPEFDPILTVFYFIHNDWPLPSGVGGGSHGNNTELGIIAIDMDNAGFRQPRAGKTSPVKPEGSKGGRSQGASTTSHPKQKSPSPLKSPTLSPTAGGSIIASPQPKILDGCALATDVKVTYVSSELELIENLVQLVRRIDPDFLIGYEVTMASWGYLIERAAALSVNLTNELSRIPSKLVVEIEFYN
jgi:DNA polymerase zeta